ncbi:alpha-L-rhamnosidase-related protein [Coraliomargarita sp. W4R53]
MLDLIKIKKGIEPDSYWLLRAQVRLSSRSKVVLMFTGASVFDVSVDGDFVEEGPHRSAEVVSECQSLEIDLEAGVHAFSVLLHHEGVTTRLMEAHVAPFFAYSLEVEGELVPLEWRMQECNAFRRTNRRIGCVLGWSEWLDTRLLPEGWKQVGFDDSDWSIATPEPDQLDASIIDLGTIQRHRHQCEMIAQGKLVPMSMHDHDPAMSFAIRDLNPSKLPVAGQWWRYDLGRVQLGHIELEMDLPEGVLVQVAYAEDLTQGRVVPYLKSGGGTDSCPLDTFVSKGGRQTFRPLKPKGGRFLELHVITTQGPINLEQISFIERCYYPEAEEGAFDCDDPLLNRIWQVGVDTLRSCAEDAITDNPSRERGQWLGDAVGPGMDILAVAYSDMRPLVRGLRQAAQCVGDDGMIPAVFPGTQEYLPSFSIQWVSAIPHYYQLTRDLSVLKDLYPAAVKNLEVFQPYRVSGGLRRNPDWWNFVDWGYSGSASVFNEGCRDAETLDPALSLFYLAALKDLATWSQHLDYVDKAESYTQQYQKLHDELVSGMFAKFEPTLGYHACALALREQLFSGDDFKHCVAFLKSHLLACFPNNPEAPRLADTRVESQQLITPFFMHFSLPALVEAGEMDFVLEQIQTCWGWMLADGITTWYEVFDPRWSHCHQWSGCPTWILSRYVLGLKARFDDGVGCFDWCFEPGSLTRASGRLPLPTAGATVSVVWHLETDGSYRVELDSSQAISLSVGGKRLDFEHGRNAFSCRRDLSSGSNRWSYCGLPEAVESL